MIKEVIILAGGLGTRLKEVVQNIPKPMAEVAGKPFLVYILDYLISYKIEKVILYVGYKHEIIQAYFGTLYKTLKIEYSIENEPLGTGGALKKAINYVQNPLFFVCNGDTFFDIDLGKLESFLTKKEALGAIALKKLHNFDRYGTVEINEIGHLLTFNEKKWQKEGLINGGVYALNKVIFENIFEEKFSFETEILEKKVTQLVGMPFDNYFIDIGIPSDYQKAQIDLSPLP